MASDPILAPLGALARLAWSSLVLSTWAAAYAALLALAALLVFLLYVLYLRVSLPRLASSTSSNEPSPVVAFYHPYCNAGGGGERVLWVAVRALRRRFPKLSVVVYTGDVDAAPDQILSKARDRFNVNVDPDAIRFVYLHERHWVEAERYPVFTLLGQSLGSVALALEALSHGRPDVVVDTLGHAFTLPLFRYGGGCRTACYVHYPTISTDMLRRVRTRRRGYNNRDVIAKFRVATYAKLLYYKIFAWMYGQAGRCSEVTMVNSSWTEGHIAQLWGCPETIQKIYPPCDTEQFEQIKRQKSDDYRLISLGQFRPEKDHALQIRSMARIRDKIFEEFGASQAEKDEKWAKFKLVLIGGCRNADDEKLVSDLRNLSAHLAVDSNVEFKVNLPFGDLKQEMGTGLIGLHTMLDEHFGIAVVEMLSAGLVTLAHRSGGPQLDIVVESPPSTRTGFLAVTEEEYADAAMEVAAMSPEAQEALRERARSSARRFGEAPFEAGWIRATESLVREAESALK